jgi:hypothetical protein
MTDLITQTRDYLEAVRAPVTVDSVVDHPATPFVDRRPVRRGPLVALATATAVVLVGLVAVLLQPTDPEIARSQIVDEVIGESQENSFYAVGFDSDGILCAEAGASFDVSRQSQGVCGDSDQPDAPAYREVAAAAYQGDSFVALAGWVPTTAASVTAVYNDQIRRALELTPIPGYDLYAFGVIEDTQARFIEIDIRNETGEIIQRYFPSIGPSD